MQQWGLNLKKENPEVEKNEWRILRDRPQKLHRRFLSNINVVMTAASRAYDFRLKSFENRSTGNMENCILSSQNEPGQSLGNLFSSRGVSCDS